RHRDRLRSARRARGRHRQQQRALAGDNREHPLTMTTLLRSKLIPALCGAILLLHAQLAAAPLVQRGPSWTGKSQYVQGEVLVKFKGAAVAQGASVEARGHVLLANLGHGGWTHVKLAADQSVVDALAAYQSDPSVEAVQPNYIYRATAAP